MEHRHLWRDPRSNSILKSLAKKIMDETYGVGQRHWHVAIEFPDISRFSPACTTKNHELDFIYLTLLKLLILANSAKYWIVMIV